MSRGDWGGMRVGGQSEATIRHKKQSKAPRKTEMAIVTLGLNWAVWSPMRLN